MPVHITLHATNEQKQASAIIASYHTVFNRRIFDTAFSIPKDHFIIFDDHDDNTGCIFIIPYSDTVNGQQDMYFKSIPP